MNLLQPVSGVTELFVPVPLPVRDTNCYVLDTQDGVVIVDAGMDTSAARSVWEDFIQETGLDRQKVHFLFVTHFHPDHLGLAHWLSERLQTPVAMMRQEAAMSQRIHQSKNPSIEPDAVRAFYERHGVPAVIIEHWLALDKALRGALTIPTSFKTFEHQDVVRVGKLELRFLEQGGHTAHQGLVYLPATNALLTGDQVLARITPNVSLWPGGEENPLAEYLASLNRLLELPHPVGLPAHETLISDVNHRVAELLQHHDVRNAKILGFLDEGPAQAYGLTRRLFQRPLDDYQLRFAVGETLAHLEFLRSRGHVRLASGMETALYERA